MGDYNFNAHAAGADSCTTHDAVATLHVVDFAVGAVAPNAVSVPQGWTATAVFQVTAAGSFRLPVTLSCRGLPANATCSFSPSSTVNPTAANSTAVTLTVSAGTNTPLATSTVTVQGATSGPAATRTTAFSLTVTAPPNFTWNTTGSTAHTVKAGQTTLAYSFSAAPSGASTFPGNVTLDCSFSPPEPTLMSSSCMFNPPSIAAGAGTTPVCLTITTKGPNAGNGSSIQRRADGRAPWLPLTLPMAGIIVAGMVGGRVSRRWAAAGLCVCWVLIGLMLACGGLGSNSSPPPSPPPAVTVTVSPGTTVNLWPTVAGWPAQTQTFTATVGNASNTAVNWTVPSGGGSIDSNGNYTAPGTVPNPATIAVTATSVADPSRSGSATVNIQTPTTLGTFNVTVTATEGTIARSQGVTLTVQ